MTAFDGSIGPELLAAPIAGAFAREIARLSVDAVQDRTSSMDRLYWEISYPPGDPAWSAPDSIELVRLCRRGKRIRGTIYSIYRPDRQRRRWKFEGRRINSRQLGFIYRSTGEEYGSNGIMILGPLRRHIWCGAFYEMPNPEREVELRRRPGWKKEGRWIGPGEPEDSKAELVAADRDPQDPVRRFLAGAMTPAEIDEVAKELPRRVRRVLTESPVRTRRARFRRAFLRPLPHRLRRRFIRPNLVVASEWKSPSRTILLGDDSEDEAA
jgi:hypothetical protein